MTQNCRSTVPMIKELVHEQMNRSSKRIDGKIANVLRERKQSKRSTERQVRERRLREG